LSRVILRFNDPDLEGVYKRGRTEFYQKSLPIVAMMVGLLAAGLEYFYNQATEEETLPKYI
jgi:hypothetical protein